MGSNKTDAELIAFLRSWGKHDSLGEKEYVVVPLKRINQAADRLAAQGAEIKKARADAMRKAASIVRNYDYSKLIDRNNIDAALDAAANKLFRKAKFLQPTTRVKS